MKVLQPSQISVVLVEPSHPGNIGSTVRAMDNFGVTDLRLIDPCEIDHPESRMFAKNARYLLSKTKTYSSLSDAVKDTHLVVATSARKRDKIHTAASLETLPRILAGLSAECSVAIVFGREKSGLTNEEMSACNEWIYIPTFGQSGSLNLAQAVVVVLYELSRSYVAADPFGEREFKLASADQVEGMKNHFFRLLDRIRFIRHGARDSIRQSFSCLIGRAKPDERDVKMLRGFFSQIETQIERKEKIIRSLRSES